MYRCICTSIFCRRITSVDHEDLHRNLRQCKTRRSTYRSIDRSRIDMSIDISIDISPCMTVFAAVYCTDHFPHKTSFHSVTSTVQTIVVCLVAPYMDAIPTYSMLLIYTHIYNPGFFKKRRSRDRHCVFYYAFVLIAFVVGQNIRTGL